MVPVLVSLSELISPRTDNAVVVQVVALIALSVPAMWLARRNRDVLTFVVGLAVFLFAMIAVRILH